MTTERPPFDGDPAPGWPSLAARRRSALWRIHFWAALIASPFALSATLTGLLYLFTPQIEHVLYAHLDHVRPRHVAQPLDAAVDAARRAVPGATVQAVVPAWRPDDSVKVFLAPTVTWPEANRSMPAMAMPMPAPFGPGAAAEPLVVYVDPYTDAVLGTQAEHARFSMWSRKLHSSLLQGDRWRWMIELGASWLMVMLLTGIYLWWPRNGRPGMPQAGARGRLAWSQWHGFLGVALGILTLAMLTTGLTWSKYAGAQVRLVRDALGQQPPRPPRGLVSTVAADGTRLSWQAAADAVRRLSPDIALRLAPPRGPAGTWQVSNYDQTRPYRRVQLVMDAYSGKPLFRAEWQDLPPFAKATGIGIPFHRGELSWWNKVLLFLFGTGVLFSLVSGWVMFFRRRRTGASGWPPLLPGAWRALPPGVWIAAIMLCAIMPLLALSAPIVAAWEGWRYVRARGT